MGRDQKAELGKWGEGHAVEYLSRMGYRIEQTNWRYRRYEIDIIAWDGDVLVFIEVKTRSSGSFYAPEATVDRHKWNRLACAAGAYMIKVDHEWEIRFDAVSVWLMKSGYPKVRHLQDVFFPGRY